MATIYDGRAISAGSKTPDGAWGWSDFGWHTSYPKTMAEFCPESELAKARQNPDFSEWIGASVGNDGARQKCAASENSAMFDARVVDLPNGFTPAASFDTGFARTGIHAEE